jgi:hypothetical protein
MRLGVYFKNKYLLEGRCKFCKINERMGGILRYWGIGIIKSLLRCGGDFFVVVAGLPLLPGNTESTEHAVCSGVATIAIYSYSAAPDVNNAEIKGLVIVGRIAQFEQPCRMPSYAGWHYGCSGLGK